MPSKNPDTEAALNLAVTAHASAEGVLDETATITGWMVVGVAQDHARDGWTGYFLMMPDGFMPTHEIYGLCDIARELAKEGDEPA